MVGKLVLRALGAAIAMLAMASCSTGDLFIGDRSLSFPWDEPQQSQPVQQQADQGFAPPTLPSVGAQTFGRGPVRVALLLPLSDPNSAGAATALANGARLAMSFIETNPNIGENITITLRDSGFGPNGAVQAASAAVQDGASLILGPLDGGQVSAAGGIARNANIPLIGFANTSSAAAPGIYLLSVLPEGEARRALTYLVAKGKRGFAGAFPATPAGAEQERAFRQAVAAIGISPAAVYTYSSPTEAQGIVQQAQTMLKNGFIDTLFLPDRAAAPDFASVLQQSGTTGLQIVGSSEWEGDQRIAQTPGLSGAIYPAIDPSGLMTISADYQARFGSRPPQLATIGYTATILANARNVSMINPRYGAAALTTPSGFNGRDGVFRFLPNGQSDYALAIRQIGPGGATTVEPARL